ncbi:hypothetical protein [Paenibacillus sp. MSJ-34]|uniref:hypothetical protein n=1 Tax=Paenibacillus sp. MSJ-34 TaxID=2841529 RepID=UPI001C12421F|nr:hypothetical protein [Paenibacillus sp. MSJ-34]MBU5441418.1 hypothetical protein [Paenibacillus sp. MSJ-34]
MVVLAQSNNNNNNNNNNKNNNQGQAQAQGQGNNQNFCEIVYVRNSHIKSMSLSSQYSKDSYTTDYDIISAPDFNSVMKKLNHKFVQLNNGGPEKLDGFVVQSDDQYVFLVSDREPIKIANYHIKSVRVSSKTYGYTGNNNNNNNNNKNNNNNNNGNANNNNGANANNKSGYRSGNRSGHRSGSRSGRHRSAFDWGSYGRRRAGSSRRTGGRTRTRSRVVKRSGARASARTRTRTRTKTRTR